MKLGFSLWANGDPDEPTARQRGIRIADELLKQGHEVGFFTPGGKGSLNTKIRDRYSEGPFDALIVQRCTSLELTEYSKKFTDCLILDANDSIFDSRDPRGNEYVDMLKLYDKITTCSIHLKDKLSQYHDNIFYWPEAIDAVYLDTNSSYSKNTKNITIVWMGLHDNLAWFERSPIRWILDDVAKKISLKWIIASPMMSSSGRINAQWAKDILPGEVEHHIWKIDEVADLMAQGDMAVIPLEQSDWTWCKSCNKAASFMSLGVPVIAENTPAHRGIIVHEKNGMLCYQAEDWYNSILKLASKPKMRKAIGISGQEHARKTYNPTAIAEELIHIIRG